MTITTLKAKNQLTIPSSVIKRLGLKLHEMFAVDIEEGCIKLTPVTVEPKYTSEELATMDYIVEQEASKGKAYKSGKDFLAYLNKVAR